MKNFKHVLFVSVLLASMSAAAQETYQDTKLAAPQLTGTARYVGMGGAMEALGADISTVSSNPAGIGLFRKNQVSITAGVIAQTDAETTTQTSGGILSFNGKKSHPTFDQAGFVWSPKIKGNNWINLAFNYHKSTDFGQIINAAASLDKASQNKLVSSKAGATAGWSNLDCNYAGYKKNRKDYVPGLMTVPTTGGLAYVEASQYAYGQYQHGYIGTYDFNISGSLDNRVWLGLTIGLHDVHYNSNSLYAENLIDGNYAKSAEELKITGTGFDVKAGIIFRPLQDSPFRIGAYVNSPIFYDLTLKGSNDICIEGNNAPGTYEDTPGQFVPAYVKDTNKGLSSSYDFRLNTPWKLGVSMGHTVGNFLALGATYEYSWYDHMDNRVKNSGYYDYWSDSYYESSSSDEAMNADTRANLKGVSTIKVGAEWKPMSMLSVRLGYNYVSPMFKDNAFRDQSIDSNGVYTATSTDYTNWKATNRFTCGLGFNYQSLSIDVAYQYTTQKGDFFPFMSYRDKNNSKFDTIAQGCSVKNNRHQILMTVGYKF